MYKQVLYVNLKSPQIPILYQFFKTAKNSIVVNILMLLNVSKI